MLNALSAIGGNFLNALPSTLEQGLIYAILALGILITYTILDFPDLTVDGSFPLGGAVSSLLVVQGVSPVLALLTAALCGCGWDDMVDAVSCFHGLPHRLEFVATINGVTYYNDSISTIPEATERAVEALGNVQTVLIGGLDRGIDYDGLADFLASGRVAHVIFMYESGRRVQALTEQRSPKAALYYEKDLKSAVALAKKITSSGSVLLSPAAASYGDFKNFEERGERFREEVKEG